MKTKHTPGPWQVIGGSVYGNGGRAMLPMNGADASLLASAPELMAALQTMLDLFEPMHQDPRGLTAGGAACIAARAALTKAKGETQ